MSTRTITITITVKWKHTFSRNCANCATDECEEGDDVAVCVRSTAISSTVCVQPFALIAAISLVARMNTAHLLEELCHFKFDFQLCLQLCIL